jgi:hypothetical protein
MMIVDPVDETVGIGVAARADDIVDPGAVRVEAVPIERVVGDRRHRPQIGKRTPEAVARAHMRRVKRTRLAAEEALRKIGCVPQIQVADLRPLDADDAKEMAGWYVERARLARRDDRFADRLHANARLVGERGVVSCRRIERIDDDRFCRPARGGVGRRRRSGRADHAPTIVEGSAAAKRVYRIAPDGPRALARRALNRTARGPMRVAAEPRSTVYSRATVILR